MRASNTNFEESYQILTKVILNVIPKAFSIQEKKTFPPTQNFFIFALKTKFQRGSMATNLLLFKKESPKKSRKN